MAPEPGPTAELTIVRDPDDATASAPSVAWAVGRLRDALEAGGVPVRLAEAMTTETAGTRLLVAGAGHGAARRIADAAGVALPDEAEALALVPGGDGELLVAGSDARGLVYAVLELADRVALDDDPRAAMRVEAPVVERAANPVRSVARLFVSERHDLPWFRDEGFWDRYLSMVVAQRFNRVNLMVGLGYNFPWGITDPYLYFAYPFLVDVAGSGVRVPQLPDEERERNLSALRSISDMAVARGLEFRFGMWTHAFAWFESGDAPYTIEGLDADRHAGYCGEAVRALLDSCPSIGGLTLRTHGESGVPERSWAFWKAVFDGIARAGRPVELDLHAKGLDPETLDLAVATGLPLTVSPKFSAEHQGLPSHQAAMREQDRPPTTHDHETEGKASFMNVCEGTRPFTRYSYGDFLREDRPYDVVFRVWPGTQRVLLWGDPAMAAGLGRHASIAGSAGLEWCEPLSLEGREGTAGDAPRGGFADASLATPDDWEPHATTFRLIGRALYDPAAPPQAWRRSLRARFGPSAGDAEAALSNASRILPLVTSAHHPSASNNYYWPELYTDIAIVDDGTSVATHYYDTPEPKRFGTVTPLDPELFLTVEETARGLDDGRYSALEVAGWLEALAADAMRHLEPIATVSSEGSADARRLVADVCIEAALGRFFAGKLRAGVGYERDRSARDPDALRGALAAHRSARDAWADAVAAAEGVYVRDLTYGPQAWLRGTWADRLPAIDADLRALEALVDALGPDRRPVAPGTMASAAGPPRLPGLSHRPPDGFEPGRDLTISLETDGARPVGVALRFRHLDQSQPYREVEMTPGGDRFTASIPGAYADGVYPIQYAFVVRDGERARRYPGLGPELSDQPYVVVRPAPAGRMGGLHRGT
jgi:hypothetical protein